MTWKWSHKKTDSFMQIYFIWESHTKNITPSKYKLKLYRKNNHRHCNHKFNLKLKMRHTKKSTKFGFQNFSVMLKKIQRIPLNAVLHTDRVILNKTRRKHIDNSKYIHKMYILLHHISISMHKCFNFYGQTALYDIYPIFFFEIFFCNDINKKGDQ